MAGSRAARVAFLTSTPVFGSAPLEPGRPPRPVHDGLWLFAPNRHTLGGSSWLVQGDPARGEPDVLVDAPALTAANYEVLQRRRAVMGADGGLIVLTGRDGHGQVRQLQQWLGWPVLVQEQEAYLLPGVARLSSFAGQLEPAKGVALLWTPGPSPGACVLHLRRGEDDGLFCGRLLVPVAPALLAPLRTVRTFHWRRQLASLQQLLTWLPAGSPAWIATGAGLGALRGQSLVANGAEQLKTIAAQTF
jgi:glyoxylase-like metal-dependent hydrolase (beta-lactamase superfamily II)